MSSRRRTNRRQFLRGESAIEALGDLTHGDIESPKFTEPPTSASAQTYLVQFSRWLMACEFQIYLPAEHPAQAADAATEALTIVEQLEDQLSVYRQESEVSQLNYAAHARPFKTTGSLIQLLQNCQELWQATDGAFDVTGGPLARVWGFHERQGRVPSEKELEAALGKVGFDQITIQPSQRNVSFSQQGIEINLGAIGKGYALDRAIEKLIASDVKDFLFHGGRSSVIARGSRVPKMAETNPWTVSVRHPLRPELQLGTIHLRDRAMSTSGSATQGFQHQGKRFGHILDPRTGRPAEDILSATVIANDAATADALSTAFFVMGPEATEEFCKDRPEIAAILILPSRRSGMVDSLELNCTAEEWHPMD